MNKYTPTYLYLNHDITCNIIECVGLKSLIELSDIAVNKEKSLTSCNSGNTFVSIDLYPTTNRLIFIKNGISNNDLENSFNIHNNISTFDQNRYINSYYKFLTKNRENSINKLLL